MARFYLAAILLLFGTGVSSPALAQTGDDQCFVITQYQDWRAPNPNTIYIRVLPKRYYRLDLSRACEALKWPNVHLVLKPRGGERFCSANDWILSVSEGKQSFDEPCIVKTMTLLSPAEADALPPHQRP